MTLPSIARQLLLTLSVAAVVLGCTEPRERSADPETSFGSFSHELFSELSTRPVSDTLDIHIGMYGDLDLMAGERVVMGRYRYRIDTTDVDPVGHMNFFVRPVDSGSAVPVVLSFVHEQNEWQLRSAEHVDSQAGAESAAGAVIAQRLEPWIRAGVHEVHSARSHRQQP